MRRSDMSPRQSPASGTSARLACVSASQRATEAASVSSQPRWCGGDVLPAGCKLNFNSDTPHSRMLDTRDPMIARRHLPLGSRNLFRKAVGFGLVARARLKRCAGRTVRCFDLIDAGPALHHPRLRSRRDVIAPARPHGCARRHSSPGGGGRARAARDRAGFARVLVARPW